MAEPAARRLRELAVMADPAAAAESVAMAETVLTESAQMAQTPVSVELLDLVVPAARPRPEWLDRVGLVVLEVTAVTAAKAAYLVTVVMLATLGRVALVVLAARRHRELPGLMDLAVEPEMAAPAEMAETETHSRAQAPMVAMVETAATQVQQAPEA